MLSSLKPANGKFVLGPPVETERADRGVHRTGRPARHAVQTASARAEEEKEGVAKQTAATGRASRAKTPAKPAKHAKPKVSSAEQ